MAIGTKVKVGADISAVGRAMGKIKGMFAGIGKFGGLGLLRSNLGKTVAGITALGLGIKAVLGMKELADYTSELSDMAVQTGVSVSKLVELGEAIRLAGVPARDTSRVLSTLAANIQEAMDAPGLARDAFHDLGIYMTDIKGMKLDEVFMHIARTIGQSGGEIKNLERSMEGLFGARLGYGLLRLFKDPANFEKARRNVAALAHDLDESSFDLDALADDLGGLPVQMRGVYLGIYRVAQSVFGRNPLQGLFDGFNYENFRPLFEALRGFMDRLKNDGIGAVIGDMFEGLKEKLQELGRIFGEGIKDALKDSLSPSKIFGLSANTHGGDRSSSYLQSIERNTDRTNEMLRRIERETSTAVWA